MIETVLGTFAWCCIIGFFPLLILYSRKREECKGLRDLIEDKEDLIMYQRNLIASITEEISDKLNNSEQ